nr:MAG TPA: hypothetical protein [Caudoviricetes sp.]
MSGYVPQRMLPVPPPCARDCAGRSADCHARCCSWALYESIRGWIYAVNQRGRKARGWKWHTANTSKRSTKNGKADKLE